jgi:uncharacterized protein (TIGR02145 family)
MKRYTFLPLLLLALSFLTSNCSKKDDIVPPNTAPIAPVLPNTVTDIDGNVYNTITIGTQTWMKENLKTTRYTNGEQIPNVTDNTAWVNLTAGGYCNYANNDANAATYGRLYNWYAVNDSRKIAPKGWHVATDAELLALETYLGGWRVAGGLLKETGATHWASPNTGATNSSGFTALPGGVRKNDGPFNVIGNSGYWWAASEYNSGNAWVHSMDYSYIEVYSLYIPKRIGCSVRCVKD